jgi:hypothetical protein
VRGGRAQPSDRCPSPWSGIRGQHLKRLDNRFHGPAVVVVAEDEDGLTSRKTRRHKLVAIRECAALCWVRRQNVRHHVVVDLPVVSKQA